MNLNSRLPAVYKAMVDDYVVRLGFKFYIVSYSYKK